ncbi:NAD-dependent protein deacylase [subsurface metagenome]
MLPLIGMNIQPISPADYRTIVFFTGAGMSAESGVPTYRGRGGIWAKYNWEEVACEEAFRRNPEKVLEFHALRRQQLADCRPHRGHAVIASLEERHAHVAVVTQNIDGLHQLAGSRRVIELHGSLWRLRCSREGTIYHLSPREKSPVRCQCGAWLRPDIIWFGDCLDPEVVQRATEIIGGCDLLIAVGTSAVVWPAAGFPQLARDQGAHCIKINPEATEMSSLYHVSHQGPAGEVLPALFPAATTA